MVDLAEIQAAYYMVAATGVLVAAVFYILNLRISQRNMKQTLETRQFQLLMQLADVQKTTEGFKSFIEFAKMEWKDYDNFEKKYGSDVNLDNYAARDFIATWFKKAGLLLRYGTIDRELLYDFLGEDAIQCWNKYREIVYTQRELYSVPEYARDWEYLHGEMGKIAERRGHDITSPIIGKYSDEMREIVIAKKM